ncbi:dihydroorotase [Prevotellaceae bacterium HUN156]|nr:dihydroorotase [Prevotellaceae bacterium HUN156]
MRILIKGGRLVNEGRVFDGNIIIEDGNVIEITKQQPEASFDETIDASGCYVLPGVIDDHVHFREPGLTAKADIDSESCAAAAGGVTSYFDMPNCVPQTTTIEALEEKYELAAKKSHVNYAFFYGATNDNVDTFSKLDAHRIPGVKLFMGSSTGNMLVDRQETLERIFKNCKMPLMAHCEDTDIINRNMAKAQEAWGEDPPVSLHAMIRSEEACLTSTQKAVALAKKYGTQLHVAHISTAEELELFSACRDTVATKITAEACVGHLFFTQLDQERLGSRIKVNPSIKTPVDQFMLREALTDGRISVVGTDHAPHLLEQKEGGCAKAASGMPMIQFSLVTMLELVDQRVLSIDRMVELMSHNPARLFGVEHRGFLRPDYRADIVIVRPKSPWKVTKETILSKCGWSPMEGHEYQWKVERTLCNGQTVYANGIVNADILGEAITFNHS